MHLFRGWIRVVTFFALCASLLLTPVTGAAARSGHMPNPAIENPGFEEPVNGTDIPGWTQTYGIGYDELYYEVTTSEKYEGNASLLLDDRNSSRPLGLESSFFPVEAGIRYTASAMMKVESGSIGIYLQFFNADGERVDQSVNWMSPTNGNWQRNSAVAVAPPDAVKASILLYSSASQISFGYVDDVRIDYMEVGTFERIGSIVRGMINQDGAIGSEEGKVVVYSVFKGADEVSTAFTVIDVITREVIRSYPMPDVEGAWGVKVATDGRVYIGTHYDGGLYRYSPEDGSFEHLGRFGDETHVFSLVAGPNGKIFAGTYPGGKLFEYDPSTDAIRDLGAFDPEQKYVRSLAYDSIRDILYVGVGGTKSRVFKLYPDGTRKELLGSLLPEGGDSYSFPSGMDFAEDRLFVKLSNGDLLVIRADDDSIDYYDPDGMDIHSEKVTAVADQPGKVLFTYAGDFYIYDTATRSFSLFKEVEDGINFMEGRFVDLGTPLWPGKTFVAIGKYGNIIYYNPSSDQTSIQPARYSGAPTLIQSLHLGADNKIYAAGYMAGFASYDPVTGAISETQSLGQVESSAIRNGKMLIGAYAGARVLEYDSNQPWSAANPRTLFELRDYEQDRPFALEYADEPDQLFIGTVPSTTSLKGALSMYDFETGQLDVFRDIVPNQGIVSLLYKDGLVYAGTTVYGGLGTDGPTEQEAKLFIFDPSTKTKIFETVPIPGRKGITGLAEGPDGLIWGVAEEMIFKFDPDTKQVIESIAKLGRYKNTTWAYADLQMGLDGNMYGTSRSSFFMIRPETMEFIPLTSGYGIYLERDTLGNFYFAGGTVLWKYTPPSGPSDTTPPETTPILFPAVPSGENGWYDQPVTVSLTAKSDLNSVTETVYSLDGGMTWETYEEGSPFTLDRDGRYDLRYRSTDSAGNVEAENKLQLNVDQTSPSIEVAAPIQEIYLTSELLTLHFQLVDDASGLNHEKTVLKLDGQPVPQGEAIALYTLPLGLHTIELTSVDMAGNIASVDIVFETKASAESLQTLINRFAANKEIDNLGIANSLLKKLENGNLQGLLNEVKAQRGKHISVEMADFLIRDVQSIIE